MGPGSRAGPPAWCSSAAAPPDSATRGTARTGASPAPRSGTPVGRTCNQTCDSARCFRAGLKVPTRQRFSPASTCALFLVGCGSWMDVAERCSRGEGSPAAPGVCNPSAARGVAGEAGSGGSTRRRTGTVSGGCAAMHSCTHEHCITDSTDAKPGNSRKYAPSASPLAGPSLVRVVRGPWLRYSTDYDTVPTYCFL